MRARVLINERSRRGREFAPKVRSALQQAGIETVERDYEAVLCAGGDGTLLRGIGPAIEANVPLGIIPLGTFNELARTLEIPLEVDAAVQAIASGVTRTIDVGEVNGVYFINEASIGISSRAARLQTPQVKQRFGFVGVVWTALRAAWYTRPFHVDVAYDGARERMRTVQLTIANSHRFGGVLEVADAAIDDGWLDLYNVDIESLRAAYGVARTVLAGERRDAPGLRTLRAHAFDVRTARPHHIMADGEPAGTTPARFAVRPRALRIYVPQ